jgi:hypothetical protein
MAEIRYRDLSLPLKILVVLGWIGAIYNVAALIIGFILGFTGASS